MGFALWNGDRLFEEHFNVVSQSISWAGKESVQMAHLHVSVLILRTSVRFAAVDPGHMFPTKAQDNCGNSTPYRPQVRDLAITSWAAGFRERTVQ